MPERWKNKKRKSKEHKEFLVSFLKTDTYASLVKFLTHSRGRPLNDDGVYVEEFLKERKRKVTRGEKKPDDDTKIQVTCEPPTPMRFQELEALYEEAELTSPIKQCEVAEGNLYNYRFFPKLMDKLILSEEAIEKIEWPWYKFEIPEPPPSRDLFNPKEGYTKDNINIMLWIICWISTYWYHEHQEKIVHVTELVHYLLKVMTKLHKTHRKAIVKYTIETVRMFGNYRTIAENMSYFIQNVDIYSKYKIDYVALNKLAIAYKYLDLGINYDYEGFGNKNSQLFEDKQWFEENEFIEITEKETAELFDNHAKLDKQKRLGSIVGNEQEVKLQSPRAFTLQRNNGNFTMVEKLRIMHDNPMYEETVEKLIKHNSANRINDVAQSPLNVFVERKKTTHVQNQPETFGDFTPENGCDVEFFEEEETVEIKKRTLNIEATKDEYQYFIILTSQCHGCRKGLEGKELKEHIIVKSKSKCITKFFDSNLKIL